MVSRISISTFIGMGWFSMILDSMYGGEYVGTGAYAGAGITGGAAV
jgi:hypothetical protein